MFGVTTIAHSPLNGGDCEECLSLAHDAAVTARVTGSVGATTSVSRGGVEHAATVARIISTVALDNH